MSTPPPNTTPIFTHPEYPVPHASVSSDNGYQQFVGWGESTKCNSSYQQLWSPTHLQMIQAKITEYLHDISDRPILVPLDTISSVLSQCIASRTPRVGDIHSRYIQETPADTRDDIATLTDRTINIITTQIRNEMGIRQANQKLSIWTTLYGVGNPHGLQRFPPIKINKRRPAQMQFHMRY